MKRILSLQHGLGYGGATKSLLLTMKSLEGEFKHFTISQRVSKKTRKIVDDVKKFSEFLEMDFPSILSYVAGTLNKADFEDVKVFYPQEIIEFINSNDIDIVHINSSLFSHLLKPLKEKTNAKIIVHLREMIPDNISEINKFIIENHVKYADKIVAITNNEVQYYPKSEKIEIIPNPYEFNITDHIINRKNIENGITIGMCANFIEYKGQLDFIEMVSIVEEKCKSKNVNFKIIGYPKNTLREFVKRIIKPGFKQKFDERVRKLKIKNLQIISFTFDIYKEISSWDIYVRPDYTGQPWGRDIIEAMAMKKPVVATGTSEFFVEHGKTGFLVPPRSPQAMAEKVIELLENEEMRSAFGERGYEKIKKMCDIEEYGKRMKEIYEELICD